MVNVAGASYGNGMYMGYRNVQATSSFCNLFATVNGSSPGFSLGNWTADGYSLFQMFYFPMPVVIESVTLSAAFASAAVGYVNNPTSGFMDEINLANNTETTVSMSNSSYVPTTVIVFSMSKLLKINELKIGYKLAADIFPDDIVDALTNAHPVSNGDALSIDGSVRAWKQNTSTSKYEAEFNGQPAATTFWGKDVSFYRSRSLTVWSVPAVNATEFMDVTYASPDTTCNAISEIYLSSKHAILAASSTISVYYNGSTPANIKPPTFEGSLNQTTWVPLTTLYTYEYPSSYGPQINLPFKFGPDNIYRHFRISNFPADTLVCKVSMSGWPSNREPQEFPPIGSSSTSSTTSSGTTTTSTSGSITTTSTSGSTTTTASSSNTTTTSSGTSTTSTSGSITMTASSNTSSATSSGTFTTSTSVSTSSTASSSTTTTAMRNGTSSTATKSPTTTPKSGALQGLSLSTLAAAAALLAVLF
jgi:hypothetical protein